MRIRRLLMESVTVFAVALIVCALVSLCANLIRHGTLTIDWETAFRFAIVFGILFPWLNARRDKDA